MKASEIGDNCEIVSEVVANCLENQLKLFAQICYRNVWKTNFNNAITDGGVAPPEILLTIVMMSSNFKSLRISRNSKDCREG